MNGIERTNRVAGERLSRAAHNFWADADQVPVSGRHRKVGAAVGGFGLSQLTKRGCTVEDSIALDEREVRGHDDRRGRKRVSDECSVLLVQEPREHGARLGVETHRTPRSSSRS
jgi:hypothetical protein